VEWKTGKSWKITGHAKRGGNEKEGCGREQPKHFERTPLG